MVRQCHVRWQVRNAVVADTGEWLEIGPMRNTFSPRNEIVMVPLADVGSAYVRRLRNANRARIRQPLGSPHAVIELLERLGPVEIEMVSPQHPRRVTGAEDWEHSDGVLTARAGEAERVEIEL